MTMHMNDFQERLARIEAGGMNTRHTLFVGMDESFLLTKEKPGVARKAGFVLANAAYPATILAALALALASVIFLKMVHFHLFGNVPIGAEPLNDLAIELVLSVLLCFGLARWFWQDHARLRGYMATGVLIMAVGWHNFVFLAPAPFGLLFSDLWVAQVMAQTEFRSILIRGYSIPF